MPHGLSRGHWLLVFQRVKNAFDFYALYDKLPTMYIVRQNVMLSQVLISSRGQEVNEATDPPPPHRMAIPPPPPKRSIQERLVDGPGRRDDPPPPAKVGLE